MGNVLGQSSGADGQQRRTVRQPPEQLLKPPSPSDKQGIEFHERFVECVNANKHQVLFATWAVTIPWAWVRKSAGPVFVGSLLAVVPDILWANWRCDEYYQRFAEHVAQEVRRQQDHHPAPQPTPQQR